MTHFLDIHTTPQDDLRHIIDNAISMKKSRAGRPKGALLTVANQLWGAAA